MSYKGNKLDNRRTKIHLGIRSRIHGTAEKPRLSVYKSNKYIYAQLIDDMTGRTLAEASSLKLGSHSVNLDISTKVGEMLAERSTSAGIVNVVFDRSGYKYHGNVKALADGARSKGLKF